MSEIWKPVPNTDGCIEVSSMGRVRSFLRGCTVLKQQTDAKGYLRLSVTIKRVKRTYKVHRLVAQAFIPNPQGLPQVNHINGDKSDNRADNLEWCSNIDNSHHAMINGLWGNVFKASREANEKKRKPIIATNIKTGERLVFRSMCDAERAIGTKHISSVIKGERKQACGYTFSYAEGR